MYLKALSMRPVQSTYVLNELFLMPLPKELIDLAFDLQSLPVPLLVYMLCHFQNL